MADMGTFAVAWRVGVAVFVIVMPTLMFVQLLRFLEWLRDDELIARMAENHDIGTDGADDALAAMATSSSGRPGPRASDSPEKSEDVLVRCDACGQRNAETATYCSGCLGSLE